MNIELREGSRETVTFRLLREGAAVNLSGTIDEITLYRRDAAGTLDTFTLTANELVITDAQKGLVSWTPGAADIVRANGPYRVWIVLDEANYLPKNFPEAGEMFIEVTRGLT